MLVKNWMSKPVITVEPASTLQEATKLLKEHRIRLLPVLDKEDLVGVVTDRDLKRTSASDARPLETHELLYLIAKIRVREIMTKNPITVSEEFTVEEAAETLLRHKISGAPVVDRNGRLAGVITQTDIFRVLMSLTGMPGRGIQFGFRVENRPGSIKEVTDVLRTYGCRIASLLSTFDDRSGHRHVYVRAFDCDRTRLDEMKNKLAATATLLYVVDHREKKKEFFRDDMVPPVGGFLDEWRKLSATVPLDGES